MRQRATHLVGVTMLCCFVIGAMGCATQSTTTTPPPVAKAVPPPPPHDSNDLLLPSEPMSYESAFGLIARTYGLTDDPHTRFALAVDSTVKRYYHYKGIGELAIVEAQDYEAYPSLGIRGAQGQGLYYAFQVTKAGWRLVGIFRGNRYHWEVVDGTPRVVTHWHMSASQSDAETYPWNGRFFDNADSGLK